MSQAKKMHEDLLNQLKQSMRVSPLQTPEQPTARTPSTIVLKANKTVHSSSTSDVDIEYPSRALYLIQAWRMHGHLHADLDPLKLHKPVPTPDTELAYYGLSEKDLDALFPTGDLVGDSPLPLRDILDILQQTYSRHIAPELMHVSDTSRRNWLQHHLESKRSTPSFDADKRLRIFGKLMRAEQFERFLQTRYTGQKRFSLEGGESLIPMLDSMIQRAGKRGVKEVIMGMAHRGRLNVLANILGKSLGDIFAEFEGNQFSDTEKGAGDVKYHMGFSSDIDTVGGNLHLSLGFNPSHLEIISPVVLGSVRARQCRRKDKARREVMGVLIHGDAAFAGQGIVAESLNLGDLSGYRTGGTIHVVVNNQIGFTTNPFDARSTFYCTDIAKMVQAPVLHVNGDDPEACCMAMELAMDYRHKFRSDVVIDLVCYRRLGHNEADAPEVTQPKMYHRIHAHPTTLTLYREQLANDGILTNQESEQAITDYRTCLDNIRRENLESPHPEPKAVNSLHGRWEGFVREGADEPDTTVNLEDMQRLVRLLAQIPQGFTPHNKVKKIYQSRIAMMDGEQPIDWGCAEMMAYATLLDEGGWVRLSGQDSGRGTFFHRHAIVYDQETSKGFMPLGQVKNGNLSRFLVIDSMLSEMAVMGFEYGYSVAEPRALVIWEAQYGDFANMAQVVIDQFIAAGESKWKRMTGLVLWLPHGYEGQGAEHSSARLERYLQLCADNNMQVVYPSTPAQLFHLLRRQYHINTRKPLVIMSPKSMLRNKASTSYLEDFTDHGFRPVLPEIKLPSSQCKRIVLCSGKVHFDLLKEREARGITDIHSLRLERLYPFPSQELHALLQEAPYRDCTEILWLQEEPVNQGAWRQIKHKIFEQLRPEQTLYALARPELAAPAVGSIKRHHEQQQHLVDAALGDDVGQFLHYKLLGNGGH